MMKENNELLILEDIGKLFTRGILNKNILHAVKHISLEIKPNEIFALVGESGSGKTTLARMILHIIEPSYGKIIYKKRDVTKLRCRLEKLQFLKEIQPIFQNPYETFTPLKKIDLFFYETIKNFNLAKKESDINNKIDEVLKLVGLSFEQLSGKYPHEFSGGQIQRISIARALLTNPSLLIADEPVSMLDASLRMSLINLFKSFVKQNPISIIYITHDLATAYYVSDRVGVMLKGRLVELGGRDTINKPLHPYTQMLKEAIPKLSSEEEKIIDLSKLENGDFSEKGCEFSKRCPFVTDICSKNEPKSFIVGETLVKCWLYK